MSLFTVYCFSFFGVVNDVFLMINFFWHFSTIKRLLFCSCRYYQSYFCHKMTLKISWEIYMGYKNRIKLLFQSVGLVVKLISKITVNGQGTNQGQKKIKIIEV